MLLFQSEILVSRLGQDPLLWQEKLNQDYHKGFLVWGILTCLFLFLFIEQFHYVSKEKGSVFSSFAIII